MNYFNYKRKKQIITQRHQVVLNINYKNKNIDCNLVPSLATVHVYSVLVIIVINHCGEEFVVHSS